MKDWLQGYGFSIEYTGLSTTHSHLYQPSKHHRVCCAFQRKFSKWKQSNRRIVSIRIDLSDQCYNWIVNKWTSRFNVDNLACLRLFSAEGTISKNEWKIDWKPRYRTSLHRMSCPISWIAEIIPKMMALATLPNTNTGKPEMRSSSEVLWKQLVDCERQTWAQNTFSYLKHSIQQVWVLLRRPPAMGSVDKIVLSNVRRQILRLFCIEYWEGTHGEDVRKKRRFSSIAGTIG